MADFLPISGNLVWPVVISVAWLAGELGFRWLKLPRITFYSLVGFLFANAPVALLDADTGPAVTLLANVAFSLLLFEFGYRINLNWLKSNPWLGISGVFEAVLTFSGVFVVARYFGVEPVIALLIASLAICTSPAALVQVINEQRSSGQVTERILHLSALSCVLSVFLFKVFLSVWAYQSSETLWQTAWVGLAGMLISAAIGVVFGVVVPALLRLLGNVARDATLAFAIAVILLVALTTTLKFSPIVATLVFGLVARYRRIVFSHTQKNFGPLGGLLTLLLFVFVSLSLEWQAVVSGAVLGLALIAVRLLTKTIGIAIFSRVSGITWKKGLLTGMAMMPISVFVVILLEQTREQGLEVMSLLAPLATAALVVEIVGPILTQWALIWAKETPEKEEV